MGWPKLARIEFSVQIYSGNFSQNQEQSQTTIIHHEHQNIVYGCYSQTCYQTIWDSL